MQSQDAPADSSSGQHRPHVDDTLNAYPTCKINSPNPYSLSDLPSISNSTSSLYSNITNGFPLNDCPGSAPLVNPSHPTHYPTSKSSDPHPGGQVSTGENQPTRSSCSIGHQITTNAVTTEPCNGNTTEHAPPSYDSRSLAYCTSLEKGLAANGAGIIHAYNHNQHLGLSQQSVTSDNSAPCHSRAQATPAAAAGFVPEHTGESCPGVPTTCPRLANNVTPLSNNAAEQPSSNSSSAVPVNMSAMCVMPQPPPRARTRDPSPYAVHSQMGSAASHRSAYRAPRSRKRKLVEDAYQAGQTSNARGIPGSEAPLAASPSKRHLSEMDHVSRAGNAQQQQEVQFREASVPSGSSRNPSFATVGSGSTHYSPTFDTHCQYNNQAQLIHGAGAVTADHMDAAAQFQPYGGPVVQASPFGHQIYQHAHMTHDYQSWPMTHMDLANWSCFPQQYDQQTHGREATNRFVEQHNCLSANSSLQGLEPSSDQRLNAVAHNHFPVAPAHLYYAQGLPLDSTSIVSPSNVSPSHVPSNNSFRNDHNGLLHAQVSVEQHNYQQFPPTQLQQVQAPRVSHEPSKPVMDGHPSLNSAAASGVQRLREHKQPGGHSPPLKCTAARKPTSTLLEDSASRRVVKSEPVSTIASPQNSGRVEGSGHPMQDNHDAEHRVSQQKNSHTPPNWPATVIKSDKSPKRPRKRGKFNQEMKQKTAETRKLRACVRCRFQKQRCVNIKCNRDDKDGKQDQDSPCVGCNSYSKTSKKTLHHIPCSHAKLTDVVLYRKAGLELTERWKGVEMKNISDRVDPSNIRTIEWTQGLCDEHIKTAVKPFFPQDGDATARFWTVRRRGKVKLMSKELEPYCLVDIHKTAAEYEAYIKRNAMSSFMQQKLQPVMTGHEHKAMQGISELTYNMAMRHYWILAAENPNGTETALMRNLFILWFAMRHTTGMAWICGEDKLGMEPEQKDETYPLYGKVSLPRMILAQFDSIHYTKILNVYGSLVLTGLENVILENQPKYWFTIYICMFILLREASWASADRYRHARANHGQDMRYSIPAFVEDLQEGCNTILMHWHYYNCQLWPEPWKASTRHRDSLAHLTPEQNDLILQTRFDSGIMRQHQLWRNYQEMNGLMEAPAVKPEKEGHEYTGRQQTFDWDHPLYWVSQLFEEKWSPHPTYKRETDH